MMNSATHQKPFRNRKNKMSLRINNARQRGVVLFFSLIALVAMSLAAVALIRSVDTNNMIAGNLGFKQSTMFSSDTGVADGMVYLNGKSPTALSTSDLTEGYYAKATNALGVMLSGKDVRAILDDNTCKDVSCEELPIDSQGNTIRYVIHRMCNDALPLSDPNLRCLKGPVSAPDDDHGISTQGFTTAAPTIIYRITARVEGPKSTVSYLQTFVY